VLARSDAGPFCDGSILTTYASLDSTVDLYAPAVVGNVPPYVAPVTYTIPLESTAMPPSCWAPFSVPLLEMKVEYTSEFAPTNAGSIIVMKESCPPSDTVWKPLTTGKGTWPIDWV
jgi:hypothetical protein